MNRLKFEKRRDKLYKQLFIGEYAIVVNVTKQARAIFGRAIEKAEIVYFTSKLKETIDKEFEFIDDSCISANNDTINFDGLDLLLFYKKKIVKIWNSKFGAIEIVK